jgi:hypothetical protein
MKRFLIFYVLFFIALFQAWTKNNPLSAGESEILRNYDDKRKEGPSQISGYVFDSGNEPAIFSTVILLDSDSALIKGTVSSPEGHYVLDDIYPGNYFVMVRSIGLDTWVSPPLSVDANELIELEDIVLSTGYNELEEVTIAGRRPIVERYTDRLVLNTAHMTNAGENALELLQQAPGVLINRMTNTISLIGKEGVVVMINGKVSRMPPDAIVQMLAGMNLANIEKIELIHTPPANFDAEGSAGIINIVVRKFTDDGFNGSYSLNAGRGKGDKYGGGLNLNYRKGVVNLFGSLNHNYTLNPQATSGYRGVYQGSDFLESATYSNRPHTPTTLQNARMGADFQVTENTVIGVLGTFYDRDWYMEAFSDASYKRNGSLESTFGMPNHETNHHRSYSGNINLNHNFTSGNSINFDADFIRFNINNPSNYEIGRMAADNHFIPQYGLELERETFIDIGVLKLDYKINVTEHLQIETGIKHTRMGFTNDVAVDSLPSGGSRMLMDDYSSLSILDEDLTGSYLSVTARINEKTNLSGGLRYEYTNTNLSAVASPDIVDRHYGSWFPSLYLTRQISEKSNVNLSYARRISRPQIGQLAPFLIFTDPTTMLGGNSALQPSFTNALSLDYAFNSYRVMISYNIENGAAHWVPRVDPATNRQITRPENMVSIKVAGASFYIPWNPLSWWEMTNNLYINNSETNFNLEGNDLTFRSFNYGFNSMHTFRLPGGYNLELSGDYNSPGYMGIIKWQATGMVNMGIQKELGERWGRLRFNASNLLMSNNWYGVIDQPANNLIVDWNFIFAERVFMLTWSNTFGSDKIKSTRNRQTGAEEERRRL